MKLGDTEVTRIGLGTNRLSRTADNVAFVKAAVAAGVECRGRDREPAERGARAPAPAGSEVELAVR